MRNKQKGKKLNWYRHSTQTIMIAVHLYLTTNMSEKDIAIISNCSVQSVRRWVANSTKGRWNSDELTYTDDLKDSYKEFAQPVSRPSLENYR